MDEQLALGQDEAAALEADIRSLPGVRAARVAWTSSGRISEIHIVTLTGKAPKQTVRDVQTLASARYGLSLDYRVVSVVQLSESQSPAAPASRPALASVSWTVEGGRTTCRVELVMQDTRATGEARGPATSHGRLRLAAQAAAQALQHLDSLGQAMDVADVVVTEAAGHRVALVLLSVLSPRGEELLAGASVIRADEPDAVARAVFAAVNRRLPLLESR